MRPINAFVLMAVVVASASPAGPVPWHLDRLDQRPLPLDGQFNPGGDGAGVQAYVIDTGIRRTHSRWRPRDSRTVTC